MSKTQTVFPKVVNFIDFHGINLCVVEHNDIEYVYAKPLSDLAGLDWRRTKRTIIEEENAFLYGVITLNHPLFVAEGGSRATPSQGIYMRIDRARMYLARINTRHMKAKGNTDAAEKLLLLQVEWADVLHAYETKGVVIKDSKREGLRKDFQIISSLARCRKDLVSEKEKAALTRLIE